MTPAFFECRRPMMPNLFRKINGNDEICGEGGAGFKPLSVNFAVFSDEEDFNPNLCVKPFFHIVTTPVRRLRPRRIHPLK